MTQATYTYAVSASAPFVNPMGETVINYTCRLLADGLPVDRFLLATRADAEACGRHWCAQRNIKPLEFVGSTVAVLTTYTGHDGFPCEPVAEFLPVVYAHTPHGDRKGLYLGKARHAEHLAQSAADKTAAALTARHAGGRMPVGFGGPAWFDARPVYGSDAYVEYGQMDDLATEAREEADDRI
jgi:hypothetical protein